jgi:hypothetical protein
VRAQGQPNPLLGDVRAYTVTARVQKKAAALKETLTQNRQTLRDMASMKTLAVAMTSVSGAPGGSRSGALPPVDGAAGGHSGAQAQAQHGPTDLEVEVFKDIVRCSWTTHKAAL